MPLDQRQRGGRGVSSRCVYAGGYRRKRAHVYRVGARACTCANFFSIEIAQGQARMRARVVRARPKDAKVYW